MKIVLFSALTTDILLPTTRWWPIQVQRASLTAVCVYTSAQMQLVGVPGDDDDDGQ